MNRRSFIAGVLALLGLPRAEPAPFENVLPVPDDESLDEVLTAIKRSRERYRYWETPAARRPKSVQVKFSREVEVRFPWT